VSRFAPTLAPVVRAARCIDLSPAEFLADIEVAVTDRMRDPHEGWAIGQTTQSSGPHHPTNPIVESAEAGA
jgi:hypothetical protein